MAKAYTLTARERDTVLAALRLWQEPASMAEIGSQQANDLGTIATNCGRHVMLDMDEVDDLCERLNT